MAIHHLLVLALPTAITAVTLDCSHIRIDKQSFNLSPLSGPKTVHHLTYDPPNIENTTYTLDICNRLSPDSKTPKSERCPGGTQVCGVREGYRVGGNGKGNVERVVPIAGEFSASHGRALDPYITRLKGSASHGDSELEGLRIELHGGRYPENKEGKDQKAIIEFLCDTEVEGTEGFEKEKDGKMRRTDDKEEDGDDEVELPDLDKGKSLQFVSYKDEKPEGKDEMGVLRLSWKTKYACEGAADKAPAAPDKKAASWGFFTWFLIILFLLTATYIIFGSWLNYNRYGARGWDLIPHGDTIRDLPYIVKDFGSSMAGRMKGSDSRGGYAAV